MRILSLSLILICMSFNSFAKDCNSLAGCMKLTHELTEINFLLPDNFKDQKIVSVGVLDWSKEKAIFNLSQILWAYGYVVADFDYNKSVRIIHARDIRYQSLRLVEADKSKPELNTIVSAIGYISILYKFENEGHDLGAITSSLRTALSRYGRVVEFSNYNQVLVNDFSLNAVEILKLLRNFDIKLSSEQIKSIKDNQAEQKKMRLLRAQQPKHADHPGHK